MLGVISYVGGLGHMLGVRSYVGGQVICWGSGHMLGVRSYVGGSGHVPIYTYSLLTPVFHPNTTHPIIF